MIFKKTWFLKNVFFIDFEKNMIQNTQKPEKVKQMLDYGMKHLKFAMELCEIQRNNTVDNAAH